MRLVTASRSPGVVAQHPEKRHGHAGAAVRPWF
jgi:hypothetical protein